MYVDNLHKNQIKIKRIAYKTKRKRGLRSLRADLASRVSIGIVRQQRSLTIASKLAHLFNKSYTLKGG